MWILIKWLRQKSADLDLHCFQNRINQSSAAQGFIKMYKTGYLLVMATWAPRCDSMVAIPFPRPVPPPVMKAVFPLKVPSGSMGVLAAGKYLACSLELAFLAGMM